MFRAVVLADGDELTSPSSRRSPRRSTGSTSGSRRRRAAMSPARGRARDRAGRGARSQRHAAARRERRRAPHGGHGGGADPLRARPLPRPDVRDGPQARHRPLDALPQDEGFRPRREATKPRPDRAPAAAPATGRHAARAAAVSSRRHDVGAKRVRPSSSSRSSCALLSAATRALRPSRSSSRRSPWRTIACRLRCRVFEGLRRDWTRSAARPPSLRSTALLLVGALLMLAARPLAAIRRGHMLASSRRSAVRASLPDPCRLAPGDDAPHARPVATSCARPGSVLDAYAPPRLGGGRGSIRRRRRGRSPPPRATAWRPAPSRRARRRRAPTPVAPCRSAPVAGPGRARCRWPRPAVAPTAPAARPRHAPPRRSTPGVGPEPCAPALAPAARRRGRRATKTARAIAAFYAARGDRAALDRRRPLRRTAPAPRWRASITRPRMGSTSGRPVAVPQRRRPGGARRRRTGADAAVVAYGRQASGGRIDPRGSPARSPPSPTSPSRRACSPRCAARRRRRGLAGLQPAPARLCGAPRQAGRTAAAGRRWPTATRSRPARC